MEETSSIGLMVATLTDCHLEDIECGKYEVVFSSAENVLVKPFSCWWKKQPHRFTRVCQFASNTLWRVNLRVQLFVASKYRLRSNGGKFSNKLTADILKDFRLPENIECSKYQLVFWNTQEVLSKPFLSWLKKNCLTALLISSTCVCFCRKTVLSVFNLTHFDDCLLIACSHLPLKIEKKYMCIYQNKKKV